MDVLLGLDPIEDLNIFFYHLAKLADLGHFSIIIVHSSDKGIWKMLLTMAELTC